jgi:hypothetical protein
MNCCDDCIPCPPQKDCICSFSPGGAEAEAAKDGNDIIKLKLDLEWCWFQLATKWYCINLKERKDRFDICVQHMHEIGLCRLAYFVQTERPSTQFIQENQIKHVGACGCWGGHVRAARIRLSHPLSKQETTGFLEDDFKVHNSSDPIALRDRLLRCIEQKQFLDREDAYDCLMLGGLSMTGYPTSKETIFTPRVFAACTHAYIATSTMVQTVAETSYLLHALRNGEEQALDWFYIHNFRQFMFLPQFVVQRIPNTNHSDVKQSSSSKPAGKHDKNETLGKTLLNFIEHHVATPTLRFVEHYSILYDIGIMVVLPVLFCALVFTWMWFIIRRKIWSVELGKIQNHQKQESITLPNINTPQRVQTE